MEKTMEKTKYDPTKNSEKEQLASYGKFKSAEELLNAYNSLESEFTRRSQKLKAFEEENKTNIDWENKVQKLIEKYPIATKFTDEISSEIQQGEMIKDEDCLEKALLKVLSQNYKEPSEQAKDDKVLSFVLTNEEIKEKIIDEYREKLKNKAPKILPKGGEITLNQPMKPKTIYDAGEMALKRIKEI